MFMSLPIRISAIALSVFIGHVEKALAVTPAKNNAMHATNSIDDFIILTIHGFGY